MISNYFRISSLLYLTVVLFDNMIILLYSINASIIETIPTTLPSSHEIIDNHPTTTKNVRCCCKYQYLKHHHGGRNEQNQLPTTQAIFATSHNTTTNKTTKNWNQHHISRIIRLSAWGSTIMQKGSSRGNGGGDGDNNSGSQRFTFHNLSTADKVWNILYWILIAFVGCFILCLIAQICAGVWVDEEH